MYITFLVHVYNTEKNVSNTVIAQNGNTYNKSYVSAPHDRILKYNQQKEIENNTNKEIH